jgi:hypothetical protein
MSDIPPRLGLMVHLVVAAIFLLPMRCAMADESLGLYVGGAIGLANVEATGEQIDTPSNVYLDTGSFKQNHSALKVMLGIRPISPLGAELAYTDLGHPSGSFNAYPANVTMKGGSAFAVVYLPLSLVDFFLKAGIARTQSEVIGTGVFVPNCSSNALCPQYIGIAHFQLDRTDTEFAAGTGLQYRFDSRTVHAEYERFDAAGAHPSLLSLGFTWTLL